MAINWKQFEDDIVQYIKAYSAQDEGQAAQFIVNTYDRYVKTAASDVLYNNPVIQTNPNGMIPHIREGFTIAKQDHIGSQARSGLKATFAAGVLTYWVGAKLAPTFPPAGSIQVVSNDVFNPGTPPQIIIENVNDPRIFANTLRVGVQTHLLTVSGITVSLVPQPSGPPIPIPFPFVGIN